ncbi:cupin domain protein [Aspergillus costaricaensis CBS 115574]|uniref:Cupin domain protein n=1 Tax=Aspergillus costaricaensis CBS 115574 TaxID=1448317 RepID=A0ACD1IVU0_9EURO|nr:cupin domain protein [Aspergillus costaricaensis CBS 115574]RAK93769.1 cupin domain protein [Aspergillus costaricaensis CBS 115574]
MTPETKTEFSPLRATTTYITGHNELGKAIVKEQKPAEWNPVLEDSMAFNVVYTTSEHPVNMDNDQDLTQHKRLVDNGTLGLVNPNGSVCRVVDFAPGESIDPFIHRTQSLDYGIVIEGQLDLYLEEGQVVRMGKGDIAVQRATLHGWKNPSGTDWARIAFVLLDSKPLELNGTVLGEELNNTSEIPASR